MIELGIPYSDPLADGSVIQASSQQAIQNGMNIHQLFNDLKQMRNHITLTVMLMSYLNPVWQYGWEQF